MKSILLALLLAAPGPAEKPLAGLWEVKMPETASALELREDGRFSFFFSQGALDAGAEGKWERSGDALVLTSDPKPVPPRTTLLETGRDPEPGLLIKVVDAAGKPASYLHVFAEHADGEVSAEVIQPHPGGEHRFRTEAPVKSIRVGSLIYDFASEPFPVPAGANVMRFRFEPNDYAKIDFKGERAAIEPAGSLLLEWRGLELRFRPSNDRRE